MMKQPIQPIARDDDGVIRFQQNLLVRHLVDSFDGGVISRHLAHRTGRLPGSEE
jgi:hypothetical protein